MPVYKTFKMVCITGRIALIIIALLSLTCLPSFSQVIKGTYAIRNVETGMLLRIKDANKKDGTPLVAYSPVNWKCMTWDFHHVAGQTYQLKNLFTLKTFQPKNPIVLDGVSLEQWPLLEKKESQEYEFIPLEKSTYMIKLRNTDFYLTPSHNKDTENLEIILAKKKDGKLQQWTIYKQHPDF